jgi:hypothetical protein
LNLKMVVAPPRNKAQALKDRCVIVLRLA